VLVSTEDDGLAERAETPRKEKKEKKERRKKEKMRARPEHWMGGNKQ
jgi:hypothetical protein